MPEYIHALINSPWLYLVVLLLVAVDGVVPALPSEIVVLSLASYAVTTPPATTGLVAAAALGGIIGDAIAYLLGRHVVDPRQLARKPIRRVYGWGHRSMARYGAATVIVGRYLPGGRAATTLLAGSLRYPVRRFFLFSAVAATLWAGYIVTLGRLGSAVAGHHPTLRVIPGIVVAAVASGAIGLVERHQRRRRDRRKHHKQIQGHGRRDRAHPTGRRDSPALSRRP